MGAPATAPIPSIDPIGLLERVEAVGVEASGALLFGDAGMVLVERGRVCWAVAADRQQRLGTILREHCHASVSQEALDATFRRCQEEGRPLGESLLEQGLITPGALREALLRQSIEGIHSLCQREGDVSWSDRRHARYDARFTFSPVEILGAMGAQLLPELSARAHANLARHLEGGGSGIAFTWPEWSARPVAIASIEGESFGVQGVLRLGAWATEALDLARAFCNERGIVSVSWRRGASLVAWEDGPITFVALCDNPSSLAFVLARHVRGGS